MYSEDKYTPYSANSNNVAQMLDLPDLEYIGAEEDIEPIESLNTDSPLLQKLKYCYINRIPFTQRMGLKAINAAVSRLPLSKEASTVIKEWYDSEDMKPYGSGEYLAPVNFKDWVFLDHAIFSEDCSSFTVNKKQQYFKNNLEKEEYQKAFDLHMEKHYIGSDEEAQDIEKIEDLERQRLNRVAEAVINEIEYLKDNLEYIIALPNGCSIVNKKYHVGLQFDTLHGRIAAHENGLYEMFDNQTVKYGVLYKVYIYSYYPDWDFKAEDPYNLAIVSLENSFELIDTYDGKISEKTMKILKESLTARAKRLLDNYMNKIKVSEKENFALRQMVEDYFGTKGLEVKTIKHEPITREKLYWGPLPDDKEYNDDDY